MERHARQSKSTRTVASRSQPTTVDLLKAAGIPSIREPSPSLPFGNKRGSSILVKRQLKERYL